VILLVYAAIPPFLNLESLQKTGESHVVLAQKDGRRSSIRPVRFRKNLCAICARHEPILGVCQFCVSLKIEPEINILYKFPNKHQYVAI